jgi:5-formyltetrahydrofolate cyclo-ligase
MIKEQKNELRRMMAQRRSALSPEIHRDWSNAVCERMLAHVLVPLAARAKGSPLAIMTYVPFRSELDVFPVIHWGWRKGHVMIAPKVVAGSTEMELFRINSVDDLERGTWGLREPKPDAIRWEGLVDIVIVPGLAFDRRGMRLGYGKGFYDRLYERLYERPPSPFRHLEADTGTSDPARDRDPARDPSHPLFVAPAFDFQLIERVPDEPHDRPVDVIVTEKRWIDLRTIGDL